MTIRENCVLRQVAGSYVAVAVGEESVNFNGMLTLNDSGALLWRTMEKGTDEAGLISVLTSEYEVSDEQAGYDIAEFLKTLREAGCLAD